MIDAGIKPVAGEDLRGVRAETSLETTTLTGAEVGTDDVSESVGRGLLCVDFEGVLEGLDEGKHAAAHFLNGAGEEELLLASNEGRIKRVPVQIGKKEDPYVLSMSKTIKEKTEKAVE